MKKIIQKIERSTKSKILRKNSEELNKMKNSLKEKSAGSGFSGSAYNAKGNVDHGKIVSNKKRR